MAVKRRRWRLSVEAVLERGEEERRVGRDAVRSGGVPHPYIGAGEGQEVAGRR
jgi:hypothetical protein